MDANPAACTYYGYSREELLAMKMTDINTLPIKQIRSRNAAGLLGGKAAVLTFSTGWPAATFERWRYSAGPIQVKGKKLLYSIVHDITERRQAEEDLHLSYQRLNLLAGTASELLASAMPGQQLDDICLKLPRLSALRRVSKFSGG